MKNEPVRLVLQHGDKTLGAFELREELGQRILNGHDIEAILGGYNGVTMGIAMIRAIDLKD